MKLAKEKGLLDILIAPIVMAQEKLMKTVKIKFNLSVKGKKTTEIKGEFMLPDHAIAIAKGDFHRMMNYFIAKIEGGKLDIK